MNKDILTSFRPALVMTVLFAILLGVTYPLAVSAAGQIAFPSQANGSLIERNGKIIGSAVIGQQFVDDRYFHSRPSAAGKGYDGLASSGSNLGPASQTLANRVKADIAHLQSQSPGKSVPPDLVTTSASGLDPDISPEAALYQVDRIAHVRGIAPAKLRTLVEESIERPLLGFLGEARVNVFEINRRLDQIGAN